MIAAAIILVSALDVRATPTYPEAAAALGIGATCVAFYDVLESGRAANTCVACNTSPELDPDGTHIEAFEAAMNEQMVRWRFEPYVPADNLSSLDIELDENLNLVSRDANEPEGVARSDLQLTMDFLPHSDNERPARVPAPDIDTRAECIAARPNSTQTHSEN